MSKLYALAAVVLLACGCGAPATKKTAVPLPAVPAGPSQPCSKVFQAGRLTPAPAQSVTCATTDGAPLIIPAIGCKDGGALWQISGPGAGTAGWGRAGRVFHPNDDLQDPGWLAALAECTGG